MVHRKSILIEKLDVAFESSTRKWSKTTRREDINEINEKRKQKISDPRREQNFMAHSEQPERPGPTNKMRSNTPCVRIHSSAESAMVG